MSVWGLLTVNHKKDKDQQQLKLAMNGHYFKMKVSPFFPVIVVNLEQGYICFKFKYFKLSV